MRLTCLLLTLAPAYLGMYIYMYVMCERTACDMPSAHFLLQLTLVYIYICVICVWEMLLTCLMLTLAPAYLGMCIYIWYVCEKCFWHALLCSLWLQLTLVCVYRYICDMCVRIAFDMPFAHFCSSVCGHVFGMPLDMLVAHFSLQLALAWLWHLLAAHCCPSSSTIYLLYMYVSSNAVDMQLSGCYLNYTTLLTL